MSLERKAIRHALAGLIKGKTGAGNNVFTSRAHPISSYELPCIVIYTRSEQFRLRDQAPRLYERTAKVEVEILAKANEALDDVLDALAAQVENIIGRNDTLNGAAADTQISTVEMDISDSGDEPIGSLKLTVDCVYYTESPTDISGELDSFDIASIAYDIAPSDGNNEAEDSIRLPQ